MRPPLGSIWRCLRGHFNSSLLNSLISKNWFCFHVIAPKGLSRYEYSYMIQYLNWLYKIQWSCKTMLIKCLSHFLKKNTWLRKETFIQYLCFRIFSIYNSRVCTSLRLFTAAKHVQLNKLDEQFIPKGYGWLCGCQSIFPVVTHKQRGNFWTGEAVFPPTRKSERSVARQALDSRSNRAGTLGVTPGATSRDESAHWSPVISSESVRVKGEGGKRKFYKLKWYEKVWTKLDLSVVVNWPQSS